MLSTDQSLAGETERELAPSLPLASVEVSWKKDLPRLYWRKEGRKLLLLSDMLPKLLHTLVIAMAPIVELRGAIPYGIAQGLPFWPVFLVALVGNLLPVPFIILFIRKIFAFLRRSSALGPFIERLERKAHLKGRKVNRYKTLGLFVLVAIPLPGTGAWTGSLVAAFLDIRLRRAFPAIALGVLAAGLLVAAISYSAFWALGI